jgi:hypothetical protein
MKTQSLLKILSAGFAVLLLSGLLVRANAASNLPVGAVSAHRFAAISAAPTATLFATLQFTATSTAEAKKKKSVAAEPATWLYVLGAVLLIVVLERKPLKALFHSTTSN